MSNKQPGLSWTTVGVIAVLMVAGAAYGLGNEGMEKYAPPENPALPPSDMTLDLARTEKTPDIEISSRKKISNKNPTFSKLRLFG